MTSPLLNPCDFARLLHAGACSHLARIHGVPPDVIAATEPGGLQWSDFPFEGGPENFAAEAQSFFGLHDLPVLEQRETLSASGERLHENWVKTSGSIVFHTSGSTGKPVPHPHSSAMLRQEAEALLPLFYPIERFVCTTPLFHSYGFIFGFLLPRISGRPSVILPSLPTFLADRLRPGDLLVSFPQFLGKIITPPPPSVRCLISTAPCPPGLFAALERLGFSSITEMYGSSETGAVAARTSEDDPFTLLPHWRKNDDASTLRLASGDDSESVFQLPDHVRWQDDRRLAPVGRIDKAVQVAGVNVYPKKIAACLRAHPLVKECAVRPMRPDEGARLKAFLVLADGTDIAAFRKDLRDYMKARLVTAERPARLSFGSSLPRTDSGKLCDWE